MYTINQHNNRWRILKDNELVLEGNGGITTAIAIALLYGIPLSMISY